MFEATNWTLEEKEYQEDDVLVGAVMTSKAGKKIGIVRRFEFLSKLQRMSVIIKEFGTNGFRMHIKGSPEKIREMCRPETVPTNFHHILSKYTEVPTLYSFL